MWLYIISLYYRLMWAGLLIAIYTIDYLMMKVQTNHTFRNICWLVKNDLLGWSSPSPSQANIYFNLLIPLYCHWYMVKIYYMFYALCDRVAMPALHCVDWAVNDPCRKTTPVNGRLVYIIHNSAWSFHSVLIHLPECCCECSTENWVIYTKWN